MNNQSMNNNNYSNSNGTHSTQTNNGLDGLSDTLNATLSEKDKQIYQTNNKRLQELEQEIRVFHTYGSACDELMVWLNDDRAYNQINEAAMLGCLTAIYEKHAEHGRWSGIQILRIANEKSASLSDKTRGKS